MLGFKKGYINNIIYCLLLAFFGIIILLGLLKKFSIIEGYEDSNTRYAHAVESGAIQAHNSPSNDVAQVNIAVSPGPF